MVTGKHKKRGTTSNMKNELRKQFETYNTLTQTINGAPQTTS